MALISVLGMVAATAFAYAVFSTPGSLVLAAVLSLTMARSRLTASWTGRLEALLVLPLVGVLTTAVAMLLKATPLAGAAAFVAAMFMSVWLRRFGPIGSRIGTLLALPFVTLLIVPGAGAGTTPRIAAILSVAALAIVIATRLAAEAVHLIPQAKAMPKPTAEPRSSTLRPIASTRMAIQLALALAGAFTIGRLAFADHLPWVVLTAYLVCSGNRGRADVLHKSGLRVLGAGAGTAVAIGVPIAVPSLHELAGGPVLTALLFAIIGVGLWLRERTYAAWSFAMTLVISLLQGFAIPVAEISAGTQLWQRLVAIIAGAICGLACSWWVLPVRSEPIVRRRIAEVLALISDYLVDRSPEAADRIEWARSRLDEIAPPWHAWERIGRWQGGTRNPGQWIRLVHESVDLVRTRPEASRAGRRAVGEARKALKDPAALGEALREMRDQLRA
jgi:uncharacterized membrane protein YccC